MAHPYPSPSPKTAMPTEESAVLQRKIMILRRNGWSFPRIAVEMGMNQAYIHKQYRNALKSIIREDVEDVRTMELERLDKLYKEAAKLYNTAVPLVNGGSVVRDVVEDENGDLQLRPNGEPLTVRLHDLSHKFTAMDKMIKVMERRASLLGLDAPKRKEITGAGGKPVSFFQELTLRGLDKKELETMRALAEKAAASGEGTPPVDDSEEDDDECS